MSDTKALKRRFEEVQGSRAPVESVWDEIETLHHAALGTEEVHLP